MAVATGVTGQSVDGCTLGGCHGGGLEGTYNYTDYIEYWTGSAWSTAGAVVNRNSAVSLRYVLDYVSGTVGARAGMNMSASGGTLSESNGSLQATGGEITHNTPNTLTGDISCTNCDAEFAAINWTAPNASSVYTIFACGQVVNNNGTSAGDGPHDCDTMTITVNNEPVINASAGSAAHTEQIAVTVDSALSLTDTEGNSMSSATIGITGNYSAVSGDNLTLGTCPSGASCSGSGTQTITISGGSAVGNYQTAFRSVQFNTTSNTPSTATRTVQFSVTDTFSRVRSDTRTVTVAAVNDAPVLSGVDATPVYVEGNNPGVIIDGTITVSDVDSANCNQATIELSTNYQPGEDILEYTGSVTGVTAGAFDSGTGILTLTSTTGCANLSTALENVRYRNTSLNPNTALARTVVFRVRDDGNALSNTDFTTVTVQAVSTPPTISGVDNVATYIEDTVPGVVIDDSISVTDPDSMDCNTASTVLSTNYRMGEDLLEYTGTVAGITAGIFNSAAGSLTLTGPASCSDFATALENVRYRNTSNSPDTSLRRVEFQVLDSGNVASNVDTTSINIIATNDAPLATDDVFAVAANSSNNELNVLANDSDPDVIDTLTIASVSTPDNGGTVSIGAPCAANTLCYAPPPDSTSVEMFSYTVQDAAGATDTATVSVSPSDSDGDGTADLVDNCPDIANAGQEDEDVDGIGDVCDLDSDGDGVLDGYIQFTVQQGGFNGPFILRNGGTVTLTGSLTVGVDSDALIYDWDDSSADLLDIAIVNDGVFSFDPATLLAGHYVADLNVSEGALDTHNWIILTVIENEPATDEDFDCDNDGVADNIPDCDGDGILNLTEGVRDQDNDGIPDFIDELADDNAHFLQNQTGDLSSSRFLMTEEGLNIGLGRIALRAGRRGSLISIEDIENFAGPDAALNARDSFINIGGIYDFQITGLSSSGVSVDVVIPLTSAIPLDAEYRKYSLTGGWQRFVVDSNNSIAGARSVMGLCPAPGSDDYADGLNIFDNCVQLTIQDGGPNDADGEANGVIHDPGGAAVAELIPEKPVAEVDDGGGGGVWHPCLLLLLLLRGIPIERRIFTREKP